MAFVLMLCMTLPVALRRSAPLFAVAVSWFAIFLEGGFDEDVTSQGYAAILALWVTIYSVARHGRGRHPVAGLLWALAWVVGSVLIVTGVDLPSILLVTIVTVTPWLAGFLLRREATRRTNAEQEAGRAHEDAAHQAQVAVEEERSRIARDVHDVLGHTLGLIVLQLGAADQAMDSDPVRAREAVRSARRSAKEALAEVRYLVGLHEATTDIPAPPARGLADIPGLVAQDRAAGVEVDLEFDDTGDEPLPAATDLAAFRIVQEALTNAVRHGVGPVRISVQRSAAEVAIVVSNTVRPARDAEGSGRGIIGMKERARSCGGTVSAREVPDGFLVEARLPVADSVVTTGGMS